MFKYTMDDGNTADVVYLGFVTAFGSVNYRFLLAKLESLGLCEEVVRWIKSYLTGRTTRTKRPFAELPLQCLELVGKLGPPYQSHQMQLYR